MNSEFKVVKRKRNWKSNRRLVGVTLNSAEDDCLQSLSEISRKIESAEREVNLSSYYTDLLQVIQSQLDQHERCLIAEENSIVIDEILCYGIGSFSTSVCARYQFALLLNLSKQFKSNVFIYDPIFNNKELNLLKDVYRFSVISENEEGKRSICAKGKLTFAFFPHCPHWLVNNFLWKNWGNKLNNCFIFSNSFTEVINNFTEENLKSNLRYLYKISQDCVKDLNVNNSFKFNDIFNHLSLHTFPKERILNIVEDSSFELVEPLDFVKEE